MGGLIIALSAVCFVLLATLLLLLWALGNQQQRVIALREQKQNCFAAMQAARDLHAHLHKCYTDPRMTEHLITPNHLLATKRIEDLLTGGLK